MALFDFDIGEFFQRIITPPGTGGLEAQAEQRAAAARTASAEALEAQRLAAQRAEYAALPALDKSSTMAASDAQIKKLLAAMSINFAGGSLGSSLGGLGGLGMSKLSGS